MQEILNFFNQKILCLLFRKLNGNPRQFNYRALLEVKQAPSVTQLLSTSRSQTGPFCNSIAEHFPKQAFRIYPNYIKNVFFIKNITT